MSTVSLSTLLNPEVIAVNQDPLGVQGKKVAFASSKLTNISSNVVISNCATKMDPRRLQWKYYKEDKSIRSAFNGQCLTVNTCSSSQGANIVVSDCQINDPHSPCGGKNQQWSLARFHQDLVPDLNNRWSVLIEICR